MLERRSRGGRERVTMERKGHITDMVLPNGGLRIIYGRHDKPTNPVDIPEGTRGIFLEYMHKPFNPQQILSRNIRNHTQYSGILDHAASNGVPVYFHDIGSSRHTDSVQLVKPIVEVFAMAPIFITAGSAKEGLLRSFPILYDSVGHLGAQLFAYSMKDEDVMSKTARVVAQAYPHTYPKIRRLRNAVWAEKLNWAMENIEVEGNHFTTVVGAFHIGLEKYVRKVSEGKQPRILRATNRYWGRMGDLPPFYSIYKFVPNPKTGVFELVKEIEVPKLKELAGVKS